MTEGRYSGLSLQGSALVEHALRQQGTHTVAPTLDQTMSRLNELATACGMSRDNLLLKIAEGIHGRQYGAPPGELPVRFALAQHLNQQVFGLTDQAAIPAEHVILTEGAGHAIGALMNGLQSCGYLRPEDTVAMVAPLYAPYQEICQERGLAVLPLYGTNDPDGVAAAERTLFEHAAEQIKPKVMVIVEPSNPTGRIMSKLVVEWLASLARRLGMLVVVDAVYQELLDHPSEQYTLMHELPEQTLVIYSLSKAYCQTGSRLGAMAYSVAAAQWIQERLGLEGTVHQFFVRAKDSSGGALAHVTLMPTPEQCRLLCLLLESTAHVVAWRATLKRRFVAFHAALGLVIPAGLGESIVPYYMIIALDRLLDAWASDDPAYHCLAEAMRRDMVSPAMVLARLAERGVEVLYAARFYPGREYQHRWDIRVSVANQPVPMLTEVAARMREAFLLLSRTIHSNGLIK